MRPRKSLKMISERGLSHNYSRQCKGVTPPEAFFGKLPPSALLLEPIFKTLHIMKIKATKVMAEYINDLAKENNLNLKAIPTLVGSEQIGIIDIIAI